MVAKISLLALASNPAANLVKNLVKNLASHLLADKPLSPALLQFLGSLVALGMAFLILRALWFLITGR